MNETKASWRFFTIPNMLSIFRILLIGPIIYCILHENRIYFYTGVILIFIAIISDFMDGMLARRLNQISEFGKLLDPLADKIAVAALIIALVYQRNFPVWIAVIIISRDVLIMIAGIVFASKNKFLMSSNFVGKVTASVYAYMIVAYIINVSVLMTFFTVLAVIMTFVSGIIYSHRFIKSLKQQA